MKGRVNKAAAMLLSAVMLIGNIPGSALAEDGDVLLEDDFAIFEVEDNTSDAVEKAEETAEEKAEETAEVSDASAGEEVFEDAWKAEYIEDAEALEASELVDGIMSNEESGEESIGERHGHEDSHEEIELETELSAGMPNAAASGTCGKNLTWSIDDAGTLTISGTGEMYDYQASIMPATVSYPWNAEDIKKVIIKQGVTKIGKYAFYDCANMTSVDIPQSVTDIGGWAFYGCGLTSITLPEGITSISSGMLEYCRNLTGLLIPEGVSSIGDWAFFGCGSLTSITIPEGVTSIGLAAFCDCTGLTSIYIPRGISISESAFSGARNKEIEDVYFGGSREEWEKVGEGKVKYINIHFLDAGYTIQLDKEQYVYTGEPIYPIENLMSGDKYLVKGRDYSLEYQDNIELGTGKIIIRGMGDYLGKDSEKEFPIILDKVQGAEINNIEHTRRYEIIPEEVPGADDYEITIATDEEFTDHREYPDLLTFTENKSLDRNSVYYLKLRAFHNEMTETGDIKKTYYGEWSDAYTIETTDIITLADCWSYEATTYDHVVLTYKDFRKVFNPAIAYCMSYPEYRNSLCYGYALSAMSVLCYGDREYLYDKGRFARDWKYRNGGWLNAINSYSSVSDFIKHAHIWQFKSENKTVRSENQGNAAGLYNAVRHYVNTGRDPVLISFEGDVTGNKKIGHAVSALGILEDTADQVTVIVYAPERAMGESKGAFPYDSETAGRLVLYKQNGQFNRFELQTYRAPDGNYQFSGTFSKDSSCQITYDNSVAEKFSKRTSGEYDLTDSRLIAINTAGGDGQSAYGDALAGIYHGEYDRIINYGDMMSGGNNQVEHYWVKRQETYTMSNVPGGWTISMSSDDTSVDIHVSEKCDLTIGGEGKIDIYSDNTCTAEVTMADYAQESGADKRNSRKVVLALEGGGTASVVRTDEGLQITGTTKISFEETEDADLSDDNNSIVTRNRFDNIPVNQDASYSIALPKNSSDTLKLYDIADPDTPIQLGVKKSIRDCRITLSQTKFYSDSYGTVDCNPRVTVMDGAVRLVEGVDYTIERWKNSNVAGNYGYVHVIGKGNYTDSGDAEYEIHPKPPVLKKGLPGAEADKVRLTFSLVFNVSWNDREHNVTYEVYQNTEKGWKKVDTLSVPRGGLNFTELISTIGNLQPASNYQFKVRAAYDFHGKRCYSPYSDTLTVKTGGNIPTRKISGLKKKITIKKGRKYALKPKITPANTTDKITYTSSNKKVASVSRKGIIKAKKKGSARITVRSGSRKFVVKVKVK